MPMSEMGQSHRSDGVPLTSGLPRYSDIFGVGRHFAKVPEPDVAPE